MTHYYDKRHVVFVF